MDRQIIIKAILESDWMQSAVKRPGALTKKAKAAGYANATEFASHVLANKGQYDSRTVRQASLAKTFSKFRKK